MPAPGDLVSAINDHDRNVVGEVVSAASGYVTLLPSRINNGGVWTQPPPVTVREKGCSVIERREERVTDSERERHRALVEAWAALSTPRVQARRPTRKR